MMEHEVLLKRCNVDKAIKKVFTEDFSEMQILKEHSYK